MKLEIKERKRNALMKRDVAVVSIEHGGKATPNRRQVLAEVARLLNARPEGIIIDRITTPGGRANSEARVLTYSRKEDVPAWRLRKMEQRLAKVKTDEKPPEKPPEEARPEEPTEPSGKEAEAGQGAPEEAAEEKPAEGPGQKAPEDKPEEGRTHEAKVETPSPGEDKPPEDKKREKDRPEEGAG